MPSVTAQRAFVSPALLQLVNLCQKAVSSNIKLCHLGAACSGLCLRRVIWACNYSFFFSSTAYPFLSSVGTFCSQPLSSPLLSFFINLPTDAASQRVQEAYMNFQSHIINKIFWISAKQMYLKFLKLLLKNVISQKMCLHCLILFNIWV